MDPSAEEFRPSFTYHHQPQVYFLAPPPAYVGPSQIPTYFNTSYVNTFSPGHYSNQLPQPVHVNSPLVAHVTGPQTAHVRRFEHAQVNTPPEATRTLMLSQVARVASESGIRRELEVFGDVRAVEMERARREGIVTVHFYDLRDATNALRDIRERRMHLMVWAQFVNPNMAGVPDGYNQGTLVVFNLHPSVSNINLKQLFEPFGDVKELRETPTKRHQRFIEFYDVRDAARACSQINGKEICGSRIVIEFSRPGGYKKHIHQKAVSKTPTTCAQNPRQSPQLTRENSCNSQTWKPSSHGSSNESLMSSQKQKGKKGKQVCSQNQKDTNKAKGFSYKGRRPKSLDSRFLINEEGIVDSSVSDSRTTVMIKNIPNKYSQKLIMDMLDNHCIRCNEEITSNGSDEPLSSYDFIYLPIDFINKCNVGYGFVNMTSSVAALRLYKTFHHQTWEVYNSKKICEVTYARLQGLEVLKEHFRNSKFPCAAEEYMPVIFSPPRDGRQLTNPMPVAARSHSLSSEDVTTSSHQTLTDDDHEHDHNITHDDDSGGSSSQ